MRRRGAGKCDFAHGGLELRVRANKRDRWGRHVGPPDGGGSVNLDASGGEDTLGAARSIGRIRLENGTKDGIGSASVSGIAGGGGNGSSSGGQNNSAGGANAGPGINGGGARQGKRSKGGVALGEGFGAGGVTTGGWQGQWRGRAGGTGGEADARGDPSVQGMNGAPYHRAYAAANGSSNISINSGSSRSPPRVSRGQGGVTLPTPDGGVILSPNRGVTQGPAGLLEQQGRRRPPDPVRGNAQMQAPIGPLLSPINRPRDFRVPPAVLAQLKGAIPAGGEQSQERFRGRVPVVGHIPATSPGTTANGHGTNGNVVAADSAMSDHS